MVGRRSLLLRVVPSLVALAVIRSAGEARAATRYTSRGVVRSFGKGRRYVNIHHEDIAGYMNAMTMSFEPGAPGQLDGLSEGDTVVFTFVDDGDRRVLEKIARV
jgi:Cu/Ag efflux protein CusF